MTAPRRLASALALCGLIAGCAAPPPEPPAPPPKPVLPSEQVDGLYRGTSTRFQADSRACPSPGLVILRVVGGSFEYRWNGRTRVESTVAPDGTVRGAEGTITLTGKLAEGRIEGDVSSESCGYHFRAVKRAR